MSPSDSVRRVGPVERALFLRVISGAGFDSLDPADIAIFAENTRESYFAAGESILRPGQPVCSVHVIIEGAVRVEGGEYPIPTDFGVRGSFGFPSMLSGQEDGLGPGFGQPVLGFDRLGVGLDECPGVLGEAAAHRLQEARVLGRRCEQRRHRLPAQP